MVSTDTKKIYGNILLRRFCLAYGSLKPGVGWMDGASLCCLGICPYDEMMLNKVGR